MEREIKAGLRRRSSRRVNMMASRNPARAPRNPSVIERLLKVRRPWPVSRNPVYAITTVQTIARTFTGPHTPAGFSKIISAVPPPRHTYITSALLATEIQGAPYAVDNQNRLQASKVGQQTLPSGRKLVSDRDRILTAKSAFRPTVDVIDVGQGEMMLSAHGAPRPKQAAQRATPGGGANVIRKGEFGPKAHHAPTAKSLEWRWR
jgi:hypothetical protein